MTRGSRPHHRAARPARLEQQARREARATALVDAAVEAIRRHGPGVSMDQIAAEAGVAKPILYRHFGDRGGLVLAIALRFTDELRRELGAALTMPAADPRHLLVAAIDAHVGLVEREPAVYRFVVERVTTETPDGSARLQTFLQQIGTQVTVVLREALVHAGYDSGVAEPWAFAIVGMVHGASQWWAERQTMTRAALVDSLATLLWAGLGPALTPAVPAVPVPPRRGIARSGIAPEVVSELEALS
jgi:AcrR family transcriptional regulator